MSVDGEKKYNDISVRRKLPRANPNYNVIDPDFDTDLFLNPSKLSPRPLSKFNEKGELPNKGFLADKADKAYEHVINDIINRTRTKFGNKVEEDEAKLRLRYSDFKFIPKFDPKELEQNQNKKNPYFNKDLNNSFVKTMTITAYYNLLDLILVLSKNDNFETTVRHWENELRRFHVIIIVEDGTDLKDYIFPSWMDYEAHTCESIRERLGRNAWAVGDKMGGTGNGIGIASFGSWVSSKDYNFIIDPYSRPYNSSHTDLSFLEEHLYNLVSPSNNKYFDASLDPYRPHANFPKGMPHYLKRGHHTALSQGLHINDRNYDAITQQLKFGDSQSIGAGSLPDRTRTIPQGSLFSVSMTNVMYNPNFIGPAFLVFNPNPNRLYNGHNFSEFIGVGEIIAGWAVKRTLDWTHTGAKIGPPFVERKTTREYEFGKLLEEIRYFNSTTEWYLDAYNYFQFFDVNLNTKLDRNPVCPLGFQIEIPIICFVSELQHFVGKKLGVKYPFFKYYYDVSFSYFQIWYARKTFGSELVPVSVQRSRGPYNENSTCALITIVHNEKDLFPVWLRYYMRHINVNDIYVFDHMTTDGSLDNLPEGVNKLVFDNKWIMPVLARSQLVQKYQDYFIRQGYKCVLFSDIDELIVPNPAKYPGGLKEYLQKFIEDDSKKYWRVDAYELGHMSYGDGSKASQEPKIDWSKSLLKQRKYYVKDHNYNKPLLVKVPLPYRPGFHRLWVTNIRVDTDVDLVMFHIRSIDHDWCMSRANLKQSMIYNMDPVELATGYASHWNRLDYDKKMGTLCQYAIACFVNGRDKIVRPYDNLGLTKMETLDPIWETVDV